MSKVYIVCKKCGYDWSGISYPKDEYPTEHYCNCTKDCSDDEHYCLTDETEILEEKI